MKKIKSIKNIKNLKNKSILVRCDFDISLKNNKILNDTRLLKLIPTIKYLLKKKVKQIILMGHLGRPDGKVNKKFSLLPVKNYLEKALKTKIHFANHGILRRDPKGLAPQDRLVLLENLRFYKEEEKNDKKFAKQLSKLADVYVNECFATSHRAHASISAIQDFLPSYAGLNLENEIKNLNFPPKADPPLAESKPKKPLVLIIGGAKIETKLPVINNFINKADYILVGGAVANNFLLAQGKDVGDSLMNKKYLANAKSILKKQETPKSFTTGQARNKKQINIKIQNSKIILPVDYKISKNKILDIGPKTIILFNGIIKSAKTIIWNGPMGYFEDKNFVSGTNAIAENIFKNNKAKIIIGGGETGEVVKKLYKNNPSEIANASHGARDIFISTGGGAMLEYLAGKKLPGLKRILN